jgi:hypothetical protein
LHLFYYGEDVAVYYFNDWQEGAMTEGAIRADAGPVVGNYSGKISAMAGNVNSTIQIDLLSGMPIAR